MVMLNVSLASGNFPLALIPKHQNEQLIAKGRYQYFKNDEAIDIDEPWEICSGNNSATIIRSTRYAKAYGNTISIESLQNATNTQIGMHWQQCHDADTDLVFTKYVITNDKLTYSRDINGVKKIDSLTIDSALIISPLMRIFTGEAINQLLAQNGSGEVLVPWIRDPANTDMIGTPLVSKRQANFIEDTKLEIDGKIQPCKCYQYSGGEYQTGTLFWLNNLGVLLRYVWQQDENTRWDTKLSDYVDSRS
jgi:hypothetical protein